MDKKKLKLEEVKSPMLQGRTQVKKKAPVIDTRKQGPIEKDAPSAVISDKPKTKKDIELINSALNKHFIFAGLAEENRAQLIERMMHFLLEPKEIVFEQEQSGNNFFIVISGTLNVFVNGNKVNTLKARDSFGELALLHNTPRSATIITLEKTALWGLDRKTFRTALETVNAQNYQENRQFIDVVPLFKILTNQQKDALGGSLSTLKYRAGEKIVSEGDPGDLFYLIKEGTVSCSQRSKEIRQMFRGDFFGEQALLANSLRTATVIAETNVNCIGLNRNHLEEALGSQLEKVILLNSINIAFSRSELFSKLDKSTEKTMEPLSDPCNDRQVS